MLDEKNTYSQEDQELLLSNEIDINQVFNSIKNNYKLIISLTGFSIFITFAYLLIKKPIWEGEFQIVLKEKESIMSKIDESTKQLLKLSDIQGELTDSSLKTEVEILKSTSVLKPVYNFSQNNSLKGRTKSRNLTYKSWFKDSVKVKLKRGTSVLNIKYRDNKKEIIIPVLNKIAKAYKIYSVKDRARGIDDGINYLTKQIDLYKEKSRLSIGLAQEFGIKNNMSINNLINNSLIDTIKIENRRVEAANNIKKINEQIKILEELGNNNELIVSIGKYFPIVEGTLLLDELNSIDKELLILKNLYTEKDEKIQLLSDRRKSIIKSLSIQIYQILNANKKIEESIEKASRRPKEILMQYRELIREARRDNETLVELQTNKRVLSLEKSRSEKPWELITEPTIGKKPIEPIYINVLIVGSLIGIVLGSIIAITKENIYGIVYSKEKVQGIINSENIVDLSIHSPNKSNEFINIILNQIIREEKKEIVTIKNLDVEDKYIKNIMNLINDIKSINEENTEEHTKKIEMLILQLGRSKINEIKELRYKQRIEKKQSDYIIILGQEKKASKLNKIYRYIAAKYNKIKKNIRFAIIENQKIEK